MMSGLDDRLVSRLYERAGAARWQVSTGVFAASLAASADRALAGKARSPRDVERYLGSLHLEDLALACACAEGHAPAWDHFIQHHRPLLYRSADALEPGGGAREVADGLYGELFGVQERNGERRSLFRYFHGRSSLATWLRAILSQRYVDTIRRRRRLDPLPDDDDAPGPVVAPLPDPDRPRYLALLRAALEGALARLPDRDRLRLALYYAQQLTLAQAGRILKEHEATVSRQLARTRTTVRKAVEEHLRTTAGLSEAEISECFESVAEDAGPLDLASMLGTAEAGKSSGDDRSR
jgi:RNA polymerase sigma-70 factor (ECF subfamily)